MSIAFIDMDRTILSVNSGTGWVLREWKGRRISHLKMIRALGWLGRYRIGMADLEDAIRLAVRDLEGHEEAVFRKGSVAYWNEALVDRIRPGARRCIESHKAAGDAVVLLSGTSLFLAECAQIELGLDDILCNRFVIEDGLFTGTVLEPVCYGKGKTILASAWAKNKGVALSDCVFYTDSYSDLDTLQNVGRPVAVHPDQRLRRAATRAGWPIETWD